MKNNMIDRMPIPKGTLRIQALDAAGNLLWDETTYNLVVTNGRTQICRLLGGDVTNRSVTQIAFGTSTAPTAITDVAPLASQFAKAIATVTYPNATSVTFNWTLATTEANGLTITEFGLLCANNLLFSRLTRGGIVKTNAIQLIGTWTLSF